MKITLLLVLSLLSTVATMSISGPRRLGQTQNRGNNVQRRLNFGDIKDRLLFEQAMSGGGGSTNGYAGGMASSFHARSLHQQQQNIEAIKAAMNAYPPRELQTTQSITFDEFCSTVSDIYESAGYTCECDGVDLTTVCSLYPSIVSLAYDDTIQNYASGLDCVCLDVSCDTTYCVGVDIGGSTCGVSDLLTFASAPSDVCMDCMICSTESGIIHVEADNCHTTAVGCFQTQLLASIPMSTSTQSPTLTSPPVSSSFPSTTNPTDTFATVPPTDPFFTNPPTNPLTTVPPGGSSIPNSPTDPLSTAPPTGPQQPSFNIGASSSGTIGYGALAGVVTTVFVTMSLHM